MFLNIIITFLEINLIIYLDKKDCVTQLPEGVKIEQFSP